MAVIETHAPGMFCWAELGTTDSAAGKRFYTGLFGWSFKDTPMGPDAYYTMFEIEGKPVAGLYQQDSQQQAQEVPPSWLAYISVESADRMAERTRELGGTVTMEPFDVFDVGRMMLIQDPTGAVVALWEPRSHIGAGVVGEPNTLCWNELSTNDVELAGRFYKDLLGWQPESQQMGGSRYTYFRNGDRMSAGMMQIAPEWGPVPPRWLTYFAVEDCDGKVAKAQSLGAHVPVPPADVPDVGRFAILEDPQEAMFAIVQLLPTYSSKAD
ncbi:MAG: VOC family protein [Gemmatimonadales bacterium]